MWISRPLADSCQPLNKINPPDMRRIFFIISFTFSTVIALSQNLEQFLSDSSLIHASFSLCIIDADTKIPVLEYNSGKSLTPASIMKLITSATALELLGPKYKFITAFGYTGKINKRGKLSGDIVITGGGDPTLGSAHFPGYNIDFQETWVKEIKKLGIKKIDGRVITDDSYYDYFPIPAKWLWEDAGNYYGAGAYGASVFDNAYEIHFSTLSDSSGLHIKEIVPAECSFEFSNWLVAAGTTDEGYVFAAPYSTNGWLAGSIPTNMDDFVLEASITDPPLLLAKLINDKLKASGIKTAYPPTTVRLEKGRSPGAVNPLSTLSSPPLADIIEVLNHESINMYAEHLAKELGKKFLNSGSTQAGINVICSFLDSAGIKTDGLFIEDGSGLSPLNSIDSEELVRLLIYMRDKSKYFNEYLNSFPEAGKEGTLKNYFRDEVFDSNLKAKSGSMTRVRSYAGYFTTHSGKNMAFTMIANDFSGPSRNIVKRFEELLKEIILYQ